MQIFLILALLIAIIAVIFAVQNVAVVSISFFAWHLDVSLAVALLLALAAGALIAILVAIPGRVKNSWNNTAQRKKFSSLEAERDSLKAKVDAVALDRDQYIQKLDEAKREIADLEMRLASFSAALDDAQQNSLASVTPEVVPPAQIPPDPANDALPETKKRFPFLK